MTSKKQDEYTHKVVVPNHGYDCQKCGACCSPFSADGREYSEVWANFVSDRDLARMTEPDMKHVGYSPEKIHGIKTHLHVFDGCRCPLLGGGRIGISKVKCTIYERRPTACREFKAGSQACVDARKAWGIPVV